MILQGRSPQLEGRLGGGAYFSDLGSEHVHTLQSFFCLQSFFSETVADATMANQRKAMQAASNPGVRRALRRAVLPRFRRDASEGPDGVECIVLDLLLWTKSIDLIGSRNRVSKRISNQWTQ